MKRILVWVAAALSVLLIVVFLFAPAIVDRLANRVLVAPPYPASADATRLHQRLSIVDLHGDPLLWDRDLSQRLEHGAIDIPRLIEGNVAIQCFFVVSKAPFGQNIDRTEADSDAITPLAVLQGWPRRTWGSLFERAVFQANKLRRLAAESEGHFVFIETREGLDRYVARRAETPRITAGILGVEGAHVLEGDLDNLGRLFDVGVRIVAPTHFFDNQVGGSVHGVDKGGLTDLGKQMIAKMEALHMVLDLAHAAPQVIDDALAVATQPVIVSHTGVKGTCDNNRNLTDAQVEAIAATGGVIGIGYWETAVCGTDADSIARAIRYTADLVGVEHVALGSDFDGAVPVPFDTTGLPLLVEALLSAGFDENEIAKIMGENAVRVFRETLPN